MLMLLVWDHTLRNAALAWKANATARRPMPEHMEILPYEKENFQGLKSLHPPLPREYFRL